MKGGFMHKVLNTEEGKPPEGKPLKSRDLKHMRIPPGHSLEDSQGGRRGRGGRG